MKKILIGEKDGDILRFLVDLFSRRGDRAVIAKIAEAVVDLALEEQPNFALLNFMNPGGEGLVACRQLRENPRTRNLPILILSEVASEKNRIEGLEAGCDDYMPIPFGPDELLLRMRSIERRANPPLVHSGTIEIGDLLVIDLDEQTVAVEGERTPLSPTEFRLLVFLARRMGMPQSRDTLLSQVWDGNPSGKFVGSTRSEADLSRTVDTHVRRLRVRLGPAADLVRTVRGVGYAVTPPPA